MKTTSNIYQHIIYSAVIAGLGVLLTLFMHLTIEPQITHSQTATSTFAVYQTITGESSFAVEPSDITMVGSIAGLTGGQSTGTAEFSVLSNNVNGYYVELDFFDNSSEHAMSGNVTASEALRNYGGDDTSSSTNILPSLDYSASGSSQFAYTVSSDNPTHTAQAFLNNGVACGTGGSQDLENCWKAPSTTAYEIVRNTGPAPTWATSSVIFNVTVPSGANPTPSAETYTATATLSLFNL